MGEEMLKVLIADDEKNICLMIQKLIPWERYGMEVIGLVHTGMDAVRVMGEMRPDIVISDIRMPGYDGLELVQKAHDMDIIADFIIISGYKYFEYAHKALNLGVEHYLLKPIDKKELEETLEKIIQKRYKAFKKAQEEAELKEQATYSRRKVQQHFLSSIMEQRSNLQHLDMNRVNKEYQCEFEQGYFVAIFAKLDSEVRDQDLSRLLYMMEEIIDYDFQGSDMEYINSVMQSGIITIVNYRTEAQRGVGSDREKTFLRMKHELEKFKGCHITLGRGSEKNYIAEIADSIEEAIYAVKCRSKTGLDKMIYYDRLHYQDVPIREFLDERGCQEIENITEALDYERFLGMLKKTMNYIKDTPFYSPVAVYECLERIFELVLNVLKNNQTDEKMLQQMEEDFQKTLDFYTELEEMTYRFSDLIQQYFGRVIDERKRRNQLPIRMAKQYVQENYSRQVSLEDVAAASNLSSAYLSTMFKKEMGINFSDFLISCRMEAAKKLLKNTDLPISEVAEKVGYTDSRYFSKTFNKVVGLKPSAYRKLYW